MKTHFSRRQSAIPLVLPSISTEVLLTCLTLTIWLTIGQSQAAPMPNGQMRTANDSDLSRPPSWPMPDRHAVRQQVFSWLDQLQTAKVLTTATPEAFATARALWLEKESSIDLAPQPVSDIQTTNTSRKQSKTFDSLPLVDLLDTVMETFSIVDLRCESLRKTAACRRLADTTGDVSGSILAKDILWLDDPATTVFQRDTVKLWLGRQFVRQDRFDEGLFLLADLDTSTAVDPAALLFHRAACQHWLLQADSAIESLDKLLERSGEIPVRYDRIARLLRADLTALKDESLDHIARRMRDITRRLDFGRAGPKTRTVQDGVIESLDKLIAAIEEQQNQQNQSGGGGSGSGSGKGGNGKPMDDSRIAEGKGPGEVTKRDIGDSGGWGNLPPHEREEALQQIGREFPPHYREAIEQYFKRLASGDESP